MTTAKRSAAIAMVRGDEFSVRLRARSARDEGPAGLFCFGLGRVASLAAERLTLLARVIAHVSAREPRP